LHLVKPSSLFIGTAYVGTDRLGRKLTDAEKEDLAAFLRKHDFVGASAESLRFAISLRRDRAGGKDLQGRANLRLFRQGWDPATTTLAKCLFRFVWSEHTHWNREIRTSRKAEEVFLREQAIDHSAAPSIEDFAVRLETEREEEEHGKQCIAALRASFVDAGDAVNLLWLKYRLSGIDEPGVMARLSGHEPSEFYLAADRRKRHTARLIAAESDAKYKEKK
jgi:hypothetical protein